ncbi:ribbon-helix-helix protein, CopG family [Aetokthonos hydrillicola]|jgi:predicted DNA-binding protein|nr:ribbon-helix-helix protein, CopG family [Aetokthonos hydrillicola]MBO3462649.1 ribbon-helix-helix protein, CopG family [Aetokthonos hydrillicola CCALA 1050]MBW4585781.1 ribbon-helix-helix protein, CopG family [Aetokthonos hydrillicola CCALA 1050]
MPKISDKVLTVRLPDIELDRLEKYCEQNKRTKTDVVREFIRRLKIRDE